MTGSLGGWGGPWHGSVADVLCGRTVVGRAANLSERPTATIGRAASLHERAAALGGLHERVALCARVEAGALHEMTREGCISAWQSWCPGHPAWEGCST